jgi:catechol 2,3-dioxygenase-like lactoylglutathione lyase family enzyme
VTQSIALITLLVRDYDEAIAYFTQALRFELTQDTPVSADKRWVVVAPPAATDAPNAAGRASLLLAKAATPEQEARIGDQTGGRVFMFLHTQNFWADYQHMLAHGVEFAEAPREEAYGHVVVFFDLCGNKWDLLEERDD